MATTSVVGCGDDEDLEFDCTEHGDCLEDEACIDEVCVDAPVEGDSCPEEHEGDEYEELTCVDGEWTQGVEPTQIGVLTQPPESVEAGEVFETQFELLDDEDQRIETDDVDIIVALNQGEFDTGDTEVSESTDDSGVVSFETAIDEVDTDYVLTATGDEEGLSDASVDTDSFDVVEPEAYELEYSVEPPQEVAAGESFDVAVQALNEGGDAFEFEGLDITIVPGEGNFAGGDQSMTESTDADGVAEFELVIEEARTDLILTAIGDDLALEDLSVDTEPFDVVAADADAGTSWIDGDDGVIADGENEAEIVIELRDEFENPVMGITPQFTATGTGNDYGDCSSTDDDGISTCSMTSTEAESKQLSITDPVSVDGATIEFVSACDADELECEGQCVDPDSDPDHCGGCGEACDDYPDNASPICTPSGCDFECDTGYEECGGECVDVESDIEHCTDCGIECDDYPTNASPVCTPQGCDFQCDASYESCDGQCFTASDFVDNDDHCGSCGNTCTDAPSNASPVCDGTTCDFACNVGYDECSGECVDYNNDVDHCGGCGDECTDSIPSNSEHVCEDGSCGFECVDGYRECAGECIADDECCFDVDYPGEFGGGEGTSNEPYLICTGGHLNEMSDDNAYLDQSFELTENIWLPNVFAGESNVSPIGDNTNRFEGEFDGNGYEIGGTDSAATAIINLPDTDYVGLFGAIGSDGLVKDFELYIYAEGDRHVGGLVGRNYGEVVDVYVHGGITSNDSFTGGLCGTNRGTVERSSTDVTVDGGNQMPGGLCGSNSGTIEESYSIGDVTGANRGGGFVGRNATDGTIKNSYSEGDVDLSGFRSGGFVGYNDGGTITRSWSSGEPTGSDPVGGFVGFNDDGNVNNSYWNTTWSNTTESDGGIGYETQEFSEESNFPIWDFDNIWEISPCCIPERPMLQWQDGEAP